MNPPIYLHDSDAASLRHRVNSLSQDHHSRRALASLRGEIERALVLPAESFPANVVRIGSVAEVHDLTDGDTSHYTLCFPEHAEISAGRLSVFAPLGTAILGFPVGHEFTWQMPGGPRRLRIQKVTPPSASPVTISPAAPPSPASR